MRPIIATLLTAVVTSNGLAHDWIRPENDQSKPLWGHTDGIRVGVHPIPGPRGLLRVFTPYLDQPAERLINFIAVEPIPHGQKDRGLSELEWSKLDKTHGKRFWSVDDPADPAPRADSPPSRGELTTIDGVERLRVWVLVEPFDNGAHVYLRLTFRADRRHEFAIETFAREDSKPLDRCIVTATMGNWARLRNLELAGETASALKLWPDYKADGFAPHVSFPLQRLARAPDGGAVAFAAPDEFEPTKASYAPGTQSHWRYVGRRARQFWRCDKPDADLRVQVNGRYTYWLSNAPIPGGIAFENFEMTAPFRQGQEFTFGVEPLETQSEK